MKIVHDGGSVFVSDYFKHFLFSLGTQDVTISPYKSQTNNSERTIRFVKNILRAYVDIEQKNWAQLLPTAAYSINVSINETIKMTPSELFLGRKMYNPLDSRWFFDLELDDEINSKERYQTAALNIDKAWKRREKVYNQKHVADKLPIGELVLVKNFQKSSLLKHFNPKLAPLYSGPFVILNYPTQNTVWLQSKENPNVRLKRDIQFIKKYYPSREV